MSSGLLQLRGESWVAERLGLTELFAGVTSTEQRRERVRAELLSRGLAPVVVGRAAKGGAETWEVLFERLYGEPLVKIRSAAV